MSLSMETEYITETLGGKWAYWIDIDERYQTEVSERSA